MYRTVYTSLEVYCITVFSIMANCPTRAQVIVAHDVGFDQYLVNTLASFQ